MTTKEETDKSRRITQQLTRDIMVLRRQNANLRAEKAVLEVNLKDAEEMVRKFHRELESYARLHQDVVLNNCQNLYTVLARRNKEAKNDAT